MSLERKCKQRFPIFYGGEEIIMVQSKILNVMLWITTIVVLAGCPSPNNSLGSSSSIGDKKTVTIGSETLVMIYANDSTSITFPTGILDPGDFVTLTTMFWMGETEVTNAVVAAVFQWAYNNGRFSTNAGDHNGLNSSTAKYGGQQLLNLSLTECRVDYDGSGNFLAEAMYENNPVTNITWYGAVIFCNWLTEMQDGNTDNLVYTGIDTDWLDDETIETVSNTGYRLPSEYEWEYTSRYRSADSINSVNGYSNPYFTRGNSASGATDDVSNVSACRVVAVYNKSTPVPTDEAVVKSLGVNSSNALGIYDMSGNVWEWSFTESGVERFMLGGGWHNHEDNLQVGNRDDASPDINQNFLGFRLCRTANN